MDSIFVIDDNNSNSVSGKTSFPEYPEELPPKNVTIAWINVWHDDLISIGLSAPLRGEEPRTSSRSWLIGIC